MNREEIIALAIECGDDWYSTLPADQDFLIRFASLVAAAEREACANICDERERANIYGVNQCANEIRKMGEK